MDIVHMYEQSQRMVFMQPMSEKLVIAPAQFNAVVDVLIDKAQRELQSEGLAVEDAQSAGRGAAWGIESRQPALFSGRA